MTSIKINLIIIIKMFSQLIKKINQNKQNNSLKINKSKIKIKGNRNIYGKKHINYMNNSDYNIKNNINKIGKNM